MTGLSFEYFFMRLTDDEGKDSGNSISDAATMMDQLNESSIIGPPDVVLKGDHSNSITR